jgi:hypothetical protein
MAAPKEPVSVWTPALRSRSTIASIIGSAISGGAAPT